MKYIDHGRGGDADVLQLAERDMPEVGAGEVLIRVAYAGVNRPDVLQRMGSYPPPRGASPWLGLEVSGVVAAVGQGVPEWKKGDRVCALVDGGGYAEYVTAPAGQVLPVPAGFSMAQAASLFETAFTVWANVVEREEVMVRTMWGKSRSCTAPVRMVKYNPFRTSSQASSLKPTFLC